MASAKKAAETALRQSLCVKKGERVLIITDKAKLKIGKIFYEAAKELAEAKIIVKPDGKVDGEEPSEELAREMLKYNVLIIPVYHSMTHTNAVKACCKKGARVASMPGITEDMMKKTFAIDYRKLRKRAKKLKDILDRGHIVRVFTKKGTNLSFSIRHREAEKGDGDISSKGKVHNLPAGEVFIAPVEGTAVGTVVIDGSMLNKTVKSVIKITVEKGFAVKIEGKKDAKELFRVLKKVKDKNAFNIAEFGIGANDKARLTGNILEDEKAIGTCHIALGKNSSFGGKVDVPIHIDTVFRKPTVYVDGKKIMKDGKLLI
jgi:leucyl aminopeptidase (aminopeptidase T)